MPESDDDERTITAFGRCETCGLIRDASVEEGDLVLKCPNGHRAE